MMGYIEFNLQKTEFTKKDCRVKRVYVLIASVTFLLPTIIMAGNTGNTSGICVPQGASPAKYPKGTPACTPLCHFPSLPNEPVRTPQGVKLTNCDVFQDNIGNCEGGLQVFREHNCRLNCCFLWSEALQGTGCLAYDQFCN